MTRERKCMASSTNPSSPGQLEEVNAERCCGYPKEEAPCGSIKCPGRELQNKICILLIHGQFQAIS